MSHINKRLINNEIPKGYVFFGIFVFLFMALMFFVELKNGKFETNDFAVYYQATKDFFLGNNPYSKSYGLSTGYFKYPPTTLYLFSPINFFNYFSAQIIHTILIYVSLVLSITSLHRLLYLNFFNKKSKSSFALLYVAFGFITIHIVREVHMGNVNLFLLVLFVLGINSFQNSKLTLMVVFWSLMVIIKPIVILAFIPMIFFKFWKPIATMFLLGIGYFILPMFHIGFSNTLQLWLNWFNSVSHHGEYIVSENSLKYLSNFYLGLSSVWISSICFMILLIFAMIRNLKKRKYSKDEFVNWTSVFMAFVPNFFVTDTEHFLLTLPLLLLILKQLIALRNTFLWIIFGILVICFSLKSNDLLGENLSLFYSSYGILGVANLCFIVLFILIKNRQFQNGTLLVSESVKTNFK